MATSVSLPLLERLHAAGQVVKVPADNRTWAVRDGLWVLGGVYEPTERCYYFTPLAAKIAAVMMEKGTWKGVLAQLICEEVTGPSVYTLAKEAVSSY